MIKRTTWVVAALSLALTTHAVLAADDCGPLQQVNTVDLQMSQSNDRAYLPVTINGTEKTFMLDTGGFATQISPSVAKELKLPITESGGRILDLYGHGSEGAATISTFGLGRLRAQNTTVLLSTFDSNGDGQVVGIFAPDFMGEYDVELDFAARKMNYFSPEHCAGHVIYWHTPVVAIVPMAFREDHHIVISVTLDGHPFKAVIDTGSPATLIRASEANRVFGITGPGAGDISMADIQGEKRFVHTFQSLSLEGVGIDNPHVEVFPELVGRNDPNNGTQTGSLIKHDDDIDGEPAITIGMNILSKLHLYIAFKEQKLYVTPASPPAAPPP